MSKIKLVILFICIFLVGEAIGNQNYISLSYNYNQLNEDIMAYNEVNVNYDYLPAEVQSAITDSVVIGEGHYKNSDNLSLENGSYNIYLTSGYSHGTIIINDQEYDICYEDDCMNSIEDITINNDDEINVVTGEFQFIKIAE